MSKPNVVFICADQWRGDCLGYLRGVHPVMTPHLNQLAREGMAFDNAYADCPVCMPQRATFLTGQVASRFGELANFSTPTPVDSAHTLPALMRDQAGYQTKAIGKMHFLPERARLGFEHITLHPDDYIIWLEEQGLGGRFRGHGLGGNEVYPGFSAVPREYTHSRWITQRAMDFLHQRDPMNPFYLHMVFESPHSPFDPPEPFDRMYDRISIPPPYQPDWEPADYAPLRSRTLSSKYQDMTDEMVLEARRKYYGLLTEIDYNLGLFFGELKTMGLYDDTLIIFTSDHGEMLGDYGAFAKSCYLTGAGSVPLIVKMPGRHPLGGRRVGTPALTADIFPTIAEAAGVNPTAPVDGVSLTGIAGDESSRTIFGQYGRLAMDTSAFAFDGTYKYIYYPWMGREQLFDQAADPGNERNLADRADKAAARDRLRKDLWEYLRSMNSALVTTDGFVENREPMDDDRLLRSAPQALRGRMGYGMGYHGDR